MPNPSHSAVHISQPLTDLSVSRAAANRDKYGARKAFLAVGVMKQSDKYYTYDTGDLLRSDAQRRGPGAEVSIGGYRVSTDSYFCDRWALGRDIDDPTRANADPQFNLDAEAVDYVTDKINMAADKEWLDTAFTTGVWSGTGSSTDMTGGSSAPVSTSTGFLHWNDVASTPIEDIRGEMVANEAKTGYRPNVLSIGAHVYLALQDHPDILDRIKNTIPGSPATINRELLAGLFELEEVNVLRASLNSGAELAANSIAYMAGKHALLTYRPAAPGLRTPASGYTFVWTGTGVPMEGVRIKRYRLERNESDRVEGETWLDYKIVAADMGVFFNGAVV